MLVIKYVIKDETWSFRFLTSAEFDKLHPEESDYPPGLTDTDERTVDFIESSFDQSKLDHEIYHVNFSYVCLEDVNEMSPENFEEIAACFYQKNKKHMDRQAKQIMRLYKMNRKKR